MATYIECEICSASFKKRPGHTVKGLNRFCGMKCKGKNQSLNMVGPKAFRYNHGLYSFGNRHRNGAQHRKFRATVLARDNYTCQFCGTTDDEMHVDHIQAFKDKPELRFELSNGRTLCKFCHYERTFGKSPLINWEAYSRWAMVTRGKPGTRIPVAAAETKRGDG